MNTMTSKKINNSNEPTDEIPSRLSNPIDNEIEKKKQKDQNSNRNNTQNRGFGLETNAQNSRQNSNFWNQESRASGFSNRGERRNEEQNNWRKNKPKDDQARNKNQNVNDRMQSSLNSTGFSNRGERRNEAQNNWRQNKPKDVHNDQDKRQMRNVNINNQNDNNAGRSERKFHINDSSSRNDQENWRYGSIRNQDRQSENNSNRFNNYNRNFDRNNQYSNINTFPKSNISSQIENTASTDVTRFWDKLSKRVFNSKFELHTDEYALWLDTWKAAAAGAKGPIKILPKAYLRLPAVTDISPTPTVIINVLIQVVHSIAFNQTSKASYHNDFSAVNILEAVFDIINLRLISLIQGNCLSNIDNLLKDVNDLDKILKPAITNSMLSNPNDTDRLARLILRQSTEINELRKKIKENASNQQLDDTQQLSIEKPPWLGWQQNPTLNWLMSGSWHMVDGLKASYASSEEYSESLLKLWTLLTFYWGSGAVWPRCTHKQGADNSASDMNVCGEPLLTAANSGLCKKCGANAAWKCFRQNHDHICKKCLLRQQDALVGSPGPQASTDIYDAVIDHEVVRRDETVYLLKNVESRKPPKIAPNWKTSYRLPISVLVAVIKLSVSRESIPRTSSIQWGEIVPYGIKSEANQDWMHRSKGCMAIRLLNKANCVGMPDETEAYFDLGVRVAIIDLRVFVPEVISVLNTFSKKDFKDQLDQIPFFGSLIGHGSTQKALELNLKDPVQKIVSCALENSEIDYVQRLDPNSKSELINEICALESIQSLSGTQLEAFAAALYSSVHCTQGPPGTGKSYIGVCLVLALDLIRKKAESRGHAVGPILVLSYKNHALDEFLIDVISQYESASKKSLSSLRGYAQHDWHRYLQPGWIIRTGKPDIESLERYTEKYLPLENNAKFNLEHIISVQRNARSVIKEVLECARSLETSLELDWTSQLDILKNNWMPQTNNKKLIPNVPLTCHSSKVVCLALLIHCIMDEYEQANHKDAVQTKRRKLTELSDVEMKDFFKNYAFKILEKLLMKSFSFDLDNLSPAIGNNIVGISKDLEHWKVPTNLSPVYFYINSWLKGKNPPPRCQALIKDILCVEEAAKNSPFCNLLHNCHSVSCLNQRIKPEMLFCIEHNCQFKDCKSERFKNKNYCSKHICPACILTDSNEVKPRNPFACNDHKCTANNCNLLQMYPFNGFCTEHSCTECVAASQTEKHFNKHFPRLNGAKVCEKHKCSVVHCNDKRLNDSIKFCTYHICRLCNKNNKLTGADRMCPQSQLCENHRCSHSNNCFDPKFESSSNCLNHSCKECIALKCPIIKPAVYKKPRNSCEIHSLCQFMNKNGKLCNTIAKKTTLYCIQHQELKNQILNINNKDKICSGITTKNIPCKSNQTGEINNKWYCQAHQDQAPKAVIKKEEPEETEETDEEDNIIDKLPNLLPVLKIETVEFFKKISCNGKFSKKENCDVAIFGTEDSSSWLCPLHDHSNKITKSTEIIEVKEAKPKLNEDESIIRVQINTKEDKPKTEQIIQINSELKTIEDEHKTDEKEENIDFGEALATNIDPDEMENYYDDEEEDQQNEELKRLQELTEIADYSDEEEKDETINRNQDSANIDEQTATIESNDHLSELKNWSWNLSHQDRLIAAAKLIRLVCNIFKRLNKIITENDLYTARKIFSEAGAKSFRSARIVGSTVVGASRRLEAIRSAGPFAVVIEEACEVIEPTLMSVLAVNTLRKLEMIGDHRQLPAFVQQCWFNFETTIPSIKTSLFERLISGTVKSSYNRNKQATNAAAILPYTVLDEQRRMRSSIADITRPDYNDLVQILDHKHTSVQLIGDVVIRNCPDKDQVNNTKIHRRLWVDKGRSVPGLSKNIYFWDLLNNSESRPIAGLSACNQSEAEAVASLTKWLFLCGCPPAAISIITPYKGQKNAITLALRKNGCFPPFNRLGKQPQRGTTLTVSTVDRYQGDENDIIILSLVRCSPGNRFVGLQNRFVVAMSRARLGFFVIGSVKAVETNRNGSEGPSHWRRFISSLNSKEEIGEQSAITSRCGNELPICCPRHGQQVKLNISKVCDFPAEKTWNQFCKLACRTVLDRCGHLCNLECHSPVISHNKKCNESLVRPCEIHSSIPLFCHEVDIEKTESLANALNRFNCKIKVDYCRPECDHIVNMDCFQKKSLENKLSTWKDCVEIVSDYIHPVCNHRFKQPKCAIKRGYELNAPKCTEKVLHKRPCGCEVSMQCYESIEESAHPTICKKSVEIARPRCGHMLSMRCFEAEKLKEDWSKQKGKSAINYPNVVEVIHGETYGPPESSIIDTILQCQVPVTYIAHCGHKMTRIPCLTSFEYASGVKKSPECSSQTEFACPICRCSVINECWLSKSIQSYKIWKDERVLTKIDSGGISISEASFNEATIPEFTSRIEKLLLKLCNSKNTILRICSPKHTTAITCNQLLEILMRKKTLNPCHSPIDRILQCKHIISVDCSKKNQIPPPECVSKVEDVFTYSCGIHKKKPNKCCELTRLITNSPKCTEQITCPRYRCAHKLTIPCFLKDKAEAYSPGEVLPAGQTTIYSHIEYCDAEIDIQACNEVVSYQYKNCGHLRMDVQCSTAFSWTENNEKQIECIQKIDFNNPVCGHQNKALCYETDLMRLWNPWTNDATKPKLTEHVLKHDENNQPIIAYSMDEKDLKLKPAPKQVTKESLVCQIPFSLNRKCGHTLLTTCSTVYWQTYSNCQEQVSIECDKTDCKHNRALSCYTNETEKRSGKRPTCKNKVSRLCKKCMINKVEIECSQVVIECNYQATITLPCNHEVSWKCGIDEDPRTNPANCQSCILEKWDSVIKSDVPLKTNQQLINQIEIKIEKFLVDSVNIIKNENVKLSNDFYDHYKCCQEIMSRYVANARNNFINISAPKTESFADLSFYELVFSEVKNDFQLNDSFYFEPKNTNYGRGCELMQLNLSNLKSCKPDDNGLIHVSVGAAYRFNILPYSAPYLASKKKQNVANKLSMSMKEKGFDGIQSSSNESTIKKFVFWEPGACFLLKSLSLKIFESCKICFDYYPAEKGYSCSKKHFLCWGCFEQHVKQASEPDSVGKCVDKNGCLLCPECSEPITLLNVAKESVPKSVFELLENLKSKIKIRKAVDEALKEQEDRLKREFERIQAIQDKEEQMAERLRLQIIEEILTLRCPRCKCAFLDYTGCAALTCRCGAGFCALCLKDCNGDAHNHVANCQDNPFKSVYITAEQFNKHHSKRRENLINEKLKDQSDKTKNLIWKKMEKDFRDLGIQISLENRAANLQNNSFFSNLRDIFF